MDGGKRLKLLGSMPMLYGFSSALFARPADWPLNARICGFIEPPEKARSIQPSRETLQEERRLCDWLARPKEELGKGCTACGKGLTSAGRPLQRCDCNSVQYCSSNCQASHWQQGHKAVCKRLMRESARTGAVGAAGGSLRIVCVNFGSMSVLDGTTVVHKDPCCASSHLCC